MLQSMGVTRSRSQLSDQTTTKHRNAEDQFVSLKQGEEQRDMESDGDDKEEGN